MIDDIPRVRECEEETSNPDDEVDVEKQVPPFLSIFY